MKLFDSTNKRHIAILREELMRVKRILTEGSEYSADEVWAAMSTEERRKVAPGQENIDIWDEIPAEVQDSINLTDYELAKYDRSGRTYLRGIERFEKQITEPVVEKFLKRIGRNSVDSLTVDQAMKLNIVLQQYLNQDVPSRSISNINPRDFGSGPSMAPGRRGWTGD